MLRRVTIVALFAMVLGVFGQAASADPGNAKSSAVITANCGGPNLMVITNGNGDFTPAHVIGSTSVFVPTAFDLTFTFTPTGGSPQVDTQTTTKAHQPSNAVTCAIPAALNTFPSPEGTFVISGTVKGFFTPSR